MSPAQSNQFHGLQGPRKSLFVQVRNAKMWQSRLWVLGKDTIGENIIRRVVNSQMVSLVAEALFVPDSDGTFKAENILYEVVFSFDVFCANKIF